MDQSMLATHAAAPVPHLRRMAAPTVRRAAMLALIGLAAIAGFVWTGQGPSAAAVALAGPDLTRLLRAMTGLKLLLAAVATAGLLWRLAAPVAWPRFATYALAAGSMAMGPGLIWGMVHVRLGALLLHAGLFALAVLLWRDPASSARLADLITARRRALRS